MSSSSPSAPITDCDYIAHAWATFANKAHEHRVHAARQNAHALATARKYPLQGAVHARTSLLTPLVEELVQQNATIDTPVRDLLGMFPEVDGTTLYIRARAEFDRYVRAMHGCKSVFDAYFARDALEDRAYVDGPLADKVFAQVTLRNLNDNVLTRKAAAAHPAVQVPCPLLDELRHLLRIAQERIAPSAAQLLRGQHTDPTYAHDTEEGLADRVHSIRAAVAESHSILDRARQTVHRDALQHKERGTRLGVFRRVLLALEGAAAKCTGKPVQELAALYAAFEQRCANETRIDVEALRVAVQSGLAADGSGPPQPLHSRLTTHLTLARQFMQVLQTKQWTTGDQEGIATYPDALRTHRVLRDALAAIVDMLRPLGPDPTLANVLGELHADRHDVRPDALSDWAALFHAHLVEVVRAEYAVQLTTGLLAKGANATNDEFVREATKLLDAAQADPKRCVVLARQVHDVQWNRMCNAAAAASVVYPSSDWTTTLAQYTEFFRRAIAALEAQAGPQALLPPPLQPTTFAQWTCPAPLWFALRSGLVALAGAGSTPHHVFLAASSSSTSSAPVTFAHAFECARHAFTAAAEAFVVA